MKIGLILNAFWVLIIIAMIITQEFYIKYGPIAHYFVFLSALIFVYWNIKVEDKEE
jgi:hypothetical protein